MKFTFDLNNSEELEGLLKKYWHLFKHWENQTEEGQLALISACPSDDYRFSNIFKILKNPTERVIGEAIRKNMRVLKYVKNPSEYIQNLSFNISPCMIQYVENPTEEMKLRVALHEGRGFEHIKNPTEKLKLIAVKSFPHNLKYIKDPSDEVIVIATKLNRIPLMNMSDYTEHMLDVIHKHFPEHRDRIERYRKDPKNVEFDVEW